jgi:hypothetical protein
MVILKKQKVQHIVPAVYIPVAVRESLNPTGQDMHLPIIRICRPSTSSSRTGDFTPETAG